jgi:7-cyano-7-deazaguanine synthase
MKESKDIKSIVLLSGGLDSATCLGFACKTYEPSQVLALFFDYGQKHKLELTRSKKIAKYYKINHKIIKINPTIFLNTSLVGEKIKIPKNQLDKHSLKKEIPSTYVPARNLLFLSFGVSLAEGLGARSIYIGVNSMDYSGYPDCRPEFISSFQSTARLATKTGVQKPFQSIQIVTPLQNKTKKQILEDALELGVPIEWTWSCYDPKGKKPCGSCDSCIIRKRGFLELGIRDPSL